MFERDDAWLSGRLDHIWDTHFPDIARLNEVSIKFKGRWKNKFGHIRELDDKSTEIVVNGLFRNLDIPDFIVDLTIAHELSHYAHGFHSPHPQKYKYPHQGGVVEKELTSRGFGCFLKQEKPWIKGPWKDLIMREFPRKHYRRPRASWLFRL